MSGLDCGQRVLLGVGPRILGTVEGMIEVVKYCSKIFTEPDPNKKREKVSRQVYVSALYNILKSMKGIRLFDRFGFNLPVPDEEPMAHLNSIIDYQELSYSSDFQDWVNNDSGEVFSGYKPTPELSHLLAHKINTTLD